MTRAASRIRARRAAAATTGTPAGSRRRRSDERLWRARRLALEPRPRPLAEPPDERLVGALAERPYRRVSLPCRAPQQDRHQDHADRRVLPAYEFPLPEPLDLHSRGERREVPDRPDIVGGGAARAEGVADEMQVHRDEGPEGDQGATLGHPTRNH